MGRPSEDEASSDDGRRWDVDSTGAEPDPDQSAPSPRRRRRGRLAPLALEGLPRTRELTELLRRAYYAAEGPVSFATVRAKIRDNGGGHYPDSSLSRMLSPNRAGKDNLAPWESYVHLFRALGADPTPHRALWEGADEEWRDRTPAPVPEPAAPELPVPPPEFRGNRPSRSRRRRLVLLVSAVGVIVVALATVVVLLAGPDHSAAPGACSRDGTPPPGPFTVAVTYRGHGHLFCRYASRYQWMSALRADEVNGLHGTSEYASFDVDDATTGTEFFASFGACSPSPTGPRCPLSFSVVHRAGGAQPWIETVEPTCAPGAVPTGRSVSEDAAWAAFFTDVASIDGAGRGTATISSGEDHVTDGRC